MSAEERKQHNCDQKVNGCIFTLISNMRCIWLNCKMVINFIIFVDLAIIFSASLKH